MNFTLTAGIIVLAVVALGIAIELSHLTRRKKRVRKAAAAPPRRLPQLERRMADAFSGPRAMYGDCFAEFSIWRHSETTRMDVSTKGPWQGLNLFTRSLIVRHLWRTLTGFTRNSALVHVDTGRPGAMVWSAEVNATFDDLGKPDPWAPAKGRVGTLLSGR